MYKLSIATSYTNPEERMDPWKEALACYEDLADEFRKYLRQVNPKYKIKRAREC